jgi:hypothetical protein
MALASAVPARAVLEVLRNSRRVVRFDSAGLIEFMRRLMFAFAQFELFIAVGPHHPLPQSTWQGCSSELNSVGAFRLEDRTMAGHSRGPAWWQ